MTNFFAGISRANDALTAARYGLEVTGQNIANANTPGYTRQRADQVAQGTVVGVPTIHSGTVTNGGVLANGAVRLNDAVVDTRVRDEHATQAQVDTTAGRLSDIENIFNEPSDTGLANQLQDFWNAWGDVANDPGNDVPRQMLVSSADSTVTMLHSMDSALDSVATASKNSLDATVESVNSAATELADLNTKIAIGSATNTDVNALLDRRDVLLDQLSSAVGAKATINGNGTVDVTVGGQALVSTGPAQNGGSGKGGPPFTAGSLEVGWAGSTGGSPVAWDPSKPVTLTIHTAPTAADGSGSTDVTLVDSEHLDAGGDPDPINTLSGSTANAELTTLNKTVPDYRGKLNDVAKALAKSVNDTQAAGFDLTGTKGDPMFDDSADPAAGGITAKSIAVASGFEADDGWKLVAAADTQSFSDPPTNSTPVGNVNGGNALAAADSGTASGSPDSAYSSLVGALGRASASATQQQSTQQVITSSVESLQTSASGVSLDEEVSNMLTYQMAFQASSRVLTTLDSMLDTLINHTGLVGQS